jgi:hypothetical protein
MALADGAQRGPVRLRAEPLEGVHQALLVVRPDWPETLEGRPRPVGWYGAAGHR